MPSLNQVFQTLFTFSGGKFVLFIIGFCITLTFILLTPVKVRKLNSKTNKIELIYINLDIGSEGFVKKVDLLKGNYTPLKKRYPFFALVSFSIALLIFGCNYMIPQSPSYTHNVEVISGNESINISQLNIDRLEYIGNNLLFCKKSTQDTPSRWDIDDFNIDNNRFYWKTTKVRPFFDCHITTSADWTYINIELYSPRNGGSPVGEKHSHDFEHLQLYFYLNETEPRYISFPTFTGFTEHPKVLLSWSEMPRVGDDYILMLDPNTNAFHERYYIHPTPSHNYAPVLISPTTIDIWSYLPTFDQTQTIISFVCFVIVLIYCFVADKFKYRYYVLLAILALICIYPLITQQYDFVGNFSFRVYENGEHPDYIDSWYSSQEGRDYIDGYGGLPYERDRWTQPSFESVIS